MSCRSVIVVERDLLIRDTLVDALCSEGYDTHAAVDIEDARVILARVPHPCLILVDLLSSRATGADFLQLRRRDDVLLQIPVAVMSSIAVDPGEGRALRHQGADAYLKKPFDLDQFFQTVHHYCGSP